MSTEKKSKIEAIYPLTAMQQGLLFHHLMEGEDQGVLQVQCVLEGSLDVNNFKTAWKETVKQHEFLRGSVHWKKIQKPILLIRPTKEIDWTVQDWSADNGENSSLDFEARLKAYKEKAKHKGIEIEKNPLLGLSVIKKNKNVHYLIWKCHHILLDGWSSSIIINDVFKIYNRLCLGLDIENVKLPSYKSYLNWKKQIDPKPAIDFWKSTFNGFDKPSLFQNNTKTSEKSIYKVFENHLSEKRSLDLKNLARYYKITINTLFQGVWSLLLYNYFNNTDVSFGTTVSGRSGDFDGIDSVTGMFANILPVRSCSKNDDTVNSLLNTLQTQQQKARNYEHFAGEKINSWINNNEKSELFNSLFVFENFPWKEIKSGKITVTSFEGGITSTYPLNFIVKITETISYDLSVDTKIISEDTLFLLSQSLEKIISLLIDKKDVTINQITSAIGPTNIALPNNLNNKQVTNKETVYVAPRNTIELKLTKIWESLFDLNYIGINDDFFELGGKSLLAVRLFNQIERDLKIKLPPTILLEHKSIGALADVIVNSANNSDQKQTSWNYIVPLKVKGTKNPLFCIHAGGGHVFFYKHLADSIGEEYPLYALQPVGIFGKQPTHHSIEAMSKDYADEIIQIQPKGTINVMVYCFSTGVGVEISSYLKNKGRQVNLIVADTIAEHRLLLDKSRLSIRVTAFFKRFISNPLKAVNEMVGYRIFFYLKPIWIKLLGSLEEQNTEKMRLHLVRLFNKYEWKTSVDQISLVLTKKIDSRYNKAILKSWEKISDGTKTISYNEIEAKHATMFDKSDVEKTAIAIKKSIIE